MHLCYLGIISWDLLYKYYLAFELDFYLNYSYDVLRLMLSTLPKRLQPYTEHSLIYENNQSWIVKLWEDQMKLWRHVAVKSRLAVLQRSNLYTYLKSCMR